MRFEIPKEDIKKVFEKIRHRPGFDESSAAFDRGKMPSEMIQSKFVSENVLEAFIAMNDHIYPGGGLERHLQEKVILKASQKNACQYCYNTHVDIAQIAGVPLAEIKELDALENLTVRESLALEYTDQVMEDSNRVSDELFSRLKGQFSQSEIAELTYLIGFINLLNWFNNSLQNRYIPGHLLENPNLN